MELNSNTIDAVLINGRQARPDNFIPYQTFDVTSVKNFRWASNSLKHKNAKAGNKKLYTLSLVCGSSEYPLEVEVNDHYIILYELDGYPVDTQKTRRLYLQSGETAKIGLEQIDTNSDSYFFRVSLPGNKRLV